VHINYVSEPTLTKFHKSDAFYRCVRGPVRSGKSTGMCVEIMKRAMEQKVGPGNVRRSRWVVVRNTYRELEDTTLNTWLMWFPEAVFGSFNRRTMTHVLQFNDIYCEVMFRALDRPDDVKKLLSLEVTGAWINEAREVPKAIVDVLGDRVEQYPPKMDEGVTWGGVFLDTNAPDEDHWWFEFEANPPRDWKFFVQPGALKEVREGIFKANPKAENIKNLNAGHNYYLKRMGGKKDSYIRVYYCNQFGFVEEGRRVHPEYSDAAHCSPSPLIPNPEHQVVVGLDYGLTPAAAFFSRRPSGQWWLFHEITTEKVGIKNFGQMCLLPYYLSTLKDFDNVSYYGDTWGNTAGQNDKRTPGMILETIGFNIEHPSIEGGTTIRREALAAPLERMIDGEPGLLIDPSCKAIRKGLSSKYVYKRLKVSGDEKFQEKPDKNWWSHVCEAAEHGMWGAGEGKALIRKPRKKTNRPRRPAIQGAWMGA